MVAASAAAYTPPCTGSWLARLDMSFTQAGTYFACIDVNKTQVYLSVN
jgi:hypothetical protein